MLRAGSLDPSSYKYRLGFPNLMALAARRTILYACFTFHNISDGDKAHVRTKVEMVERKSLDLVTLSSSCYSLIIYTV